jgi:hypothetical protein
LLLVHSDDRVRKEIASVLRHSGREHVVEASTIADVERWPRGEVVIVEAQFFTPVWLAVGAAYVVVIDPGEIDDGRDEPLVTRVAADGGWIGLRIVLEEIKLRQR